MLLNKLKPHVIAALLCGVIGIRIGWGLRAPAPAPIADKARAEALVTKVITTKTTKSDGTVIVRSEKQVSNTKVESTTTPPSPLSRYSVQVGVRKPYADLNKTYYDVQYSQRIGSSPVWGTAGMSTDRTVYLGVRIDF